MEDLEVAIVEEWVGTDFMTPGHGMRAVKVRLSKRGHRCIFLLAKYSAGKWYNREREEIETGGWRVTQWRIPPKDWRSKNVK